RVRDARRQSGSGAQAALDAARAALSVATTTLNAKRAALSTAQQNLDDARRALNAARQSHEKAKADRKKLEEPATKWEDTDKQNTRKAILAKARSTDRQDIAGLIDEALQLAHQSRADVEAWSAVFVVSCVRKAAIGLKLEATDSRGTHRGLDGRPVKA